MEGGIGESVRCWSGGIISLAEFVGEHREAVERDLLTETGHELSDVGSTLSWSALKSFLSQIKLGSALGEELNPEISAWSTRKKTNEILADIFDILQVINAQLRVIASHKPGRKPEPYDRPGQEKGKKRIGKGALPLSQMREWIENRRR